MNTPGFTRPFSPDLSVTIAAVHVVAAVTAATMGARDVTREAQWVRGGPGLIAKIVVSNLLIQQIIHQIWDHHELSTKICRMISMI